MQFKDIPVFMYSKRFWYLEMYTGFLKHFEWRLVIIFNMMMLHLRYFENKLKYISWYTYLYITKTRFKECMIVFKDNLPNSFTLPYQLI